VDGLRESRLAAAASADGSGTRLGAIGTTKQGIGPAYAAKASRSAAIRVGLLRHRGAFQAALKNAIHEHQAMYGGFEYDVQGELDK
jgi:adenylosuccinate synthase